MDLPRRRGAELFAANLRSRGDGPCRLESRQQRFRKPPLTRRWTYTFVGGSMTCPQTSAHAEMDLLHLFHSQFLQTNLRSRGDGPPEARWRGDSETKPPLTRRWTQLAGLKKAWDEQTSAHAEMDPGIGTGVADRPANLRSRGDGPPRQSGQAVPCYKPPLTRRWTQPRRGFVLR